MSAGGVGGSGSGGMIAVQTALLADVLKTSAAQSQNLMKAMVSVDLQNQFAGEKMAMAAEIINAYGGSMDVEA